MQPEEVLKYAPRLLLSLGGVLFGLAVLIALIAEGVRGSSTSWAASGC